MASLSAWQHAQDVISLIVDVLKAGNGLRSTRKRLFSRSVFTGLYFDVRLVRVQQGSGRLFVVVPKRSGNAAVRNLFKRRVRAIFRERGLTNWGYDWVFYGKLKLKQCTFATIVGAVESICRDLSVTDLSRS